MIFNLLFLVWHTGRSVSGQPFFWDTATHMNQIWETIIYTALSFFDCWDAMWNKYY